MPVARSLERAAKIYLLFILGFSSVAQNNHERQWGNEGFDKGNLFSVWKASGEVLQ